MYVCTLSAVCANGSLDPYHGSIFLHPVLPFTTAFRVTGRYPQLRSPASAHASALFLGGSEESELSDGTFRPLVSRVVVDMYRFPPKCGWRRGFSKVAFK